MFFCYLAINFFSNLTLSYFSSSYCLTWFVFCKRLVVVFFIRSDGYKTYFILAEQKFVYKFVEIKRTRNH